MTEPGRGDGLVQWLDQHLPARFPRPDRVRSEPLSGTATAQRLHLSYRTPVGDAPPTLVLKQPAADPGVRRFKESLGLPAAEVGVHRRLAAAAPVRIPHLYADVPFPPGGDSRILLLEDIGSADPAATGSPQWLRPVVRALAALHARWWGRVPADWTWLPAENAVGRAEFLRTTFRTSGTAAIGQATWLPDVLRRHAPVLAGKVPAILDHLAGGPVTVVHGDLHVGNVVVRRTPAASVGVVDWEAAARSRGATDLAFLLCSALPGKLRATWEPVLLADYCAGLMAAGITYPAGELRADFEIALLHYFVRRVAMRSVFGPVPDDPSMRTAVASIVDRDALDRLASLN